MGKSTGGKPEAREGREGRRQKLNVIYFVDSSRTRSLTISIGRLNALLFALLTMMTWSVVSIGLLAWVLRGNHELRNRLRDSLATIFEFESRYEEAFSVAYPTEPKSVEAQPPSVASLYKAGAAEGAKSAPQGAATANSAAEEAASAGAAADAKVAETAAKTLPPSAAAAAPAATAAAATAQAAAATPQGATPVIVGNPVLEKGDTALELHFDLTNKSESDKADGYVWAIAEFVTTDGQRLFIGAPTEVGASATGEPTYPQRSASFSIRRYKKKSFTFPYVKGKAGTFTTVRIGIMERSGGGRMIYNVPVEVQVGAKGAAKPASTDATPKPG
jgi:hypothetical protein